MDLTPLDNCNCGVMFKIVEGLSKSTMIVTPRLCLSELVSWMMSLTAKLDIPIFALILANNNTLILDAILLNKIIMGSRYVKVSIMG